MTLTMLESITHIFSNHAYWVVMTVSESSGRILHVAGDNVTSNRTQGFLCFHLSGERVHAMAVFRSIQVAPNYSKSIEK